ncbi:copper amine oxidase-like protein [Natranaerovirga hydrolytica]|uniref:Copper amine oxidase-like protein n=1 Tax=Natranaerovirga hydrolytica TaxID=680378 RepID=A0A4R1MTP5_9FIRM|nr:copper amine oxidase N-terminal domain-containing protein [Natranaerovirga hydrolytica]TCK93343.1 copper amine oxidase-like protein [Natranaerovirga hydrolytica]
MYMNKKWTKRVSAGMLVLTVGLTTAVPTYANSNRSNGVGVPEHVIERQESRFQEIRGRQESKFIEIKERQERKLEEKLERVNKRQQEVLENYLDEDLELLQKNTKQIEEDNEGIHIVPFENVFFNNRNVKFDTPPVIKGNRTLVPVRAITEGMGAEVVWDQETQIITVTKENVEIILELGNNIAIVNGEEVEIDTEVEIMSNRTYVPLRFISETLDVYINYDEETGSIELEEDTDIVIEQLIEEIDDLKEVLQDLSEQYNAEKENLEEAFTEEKEILSQELELLSGEDKDNVLDEMAKLEDNYQAELDEMEEEYNLLYDEINETIESLNNQLAELKEESNVQLDESEKENEEDIEEAEERIEEGNIE